MVEEYFPNPHTNPEAIQFFERAYRLQMNGELEQAVAYYKKSLEIEPTAEAYTFLGWTYSYMDQLEQAIQECLKAIETDPDFGNPYNDIGAYYLQLGKPKDAIPWLQKAKQAQRYASPEFAYTNLGRAYELLGLWPKAMIEYHESLEINPNYFPAKEALEHIEPKLN